jgi:hypothetical protein
MVLHNALVTGSLTLNGTDISNITGSSTYSASFASQLTSLNTYTGSNNTNISALHAFSSSILTYTASNDLTNATQSNRLSALEITTGSLNTASGSAITRLNTLETTTGSLNTFSGSAITRLNALETASGSAITRLNSIESNTGSYATTGSNTFIGTQTISGSIFGSGSLIINGCITSTGQIVAQTINVQQVTSSIVYSCGSNNFGTALNNSQTFTGSMFITGSNALFNVGCVGIGTTSPVQSLTVNGNVAVGGQQAFWLRDDDGFSSNASRRAWAITANYSSFGMLSFFVANATASNPLGATAALNITSGGSVGIGNSNPQAKLQVGGNIIVGSDTCYNLISGPSTGAAIQLGTNSSTFDRNLNLGFVTAGLSFGPILTINAQTGNVGIGNCTPDRRLYVTDTSVAQGTFLAYNQCSTFCGTVIEGITDRTCNSAFNLMNLKSSTTSMFIVKGDGNVGIGTGNPTPTSGKGLHIYSTSGHANLALESSTSGVKWEILSTTACNFSVYQGGGGGDRLIITNTGAATFACSVTATTLITTSPLAINLNYAGSVNDIQLGAGTPLRIVNQAYNAVLFYLNN